VSPAAQNRWTLVRRTEILNQDSRPEDAQSRTREACLHRAIEALRLRFTEISLPLPAELHVSGGFGYSSRAESKYILGRSRGGDDQVRSVVARAASHAADCATRE